MSEETTMHEELTHWRDVIDMLCEFAREMESHEQDTDYLTREINRLFKVLGNVESDEDGIVDRYYVDFEHPDNRDYKLVFEFKAFFIGGKP